MLHAHTQDLVLVFVVSCIIHAVYQHFSVFAVAYASALLFHVTQHKPGALTIDNVMQILHRIVVVTGSVVFIHRLVLYTQHINRSERYEVI